MQRCIYKSIWHRELLIIRRYAVIETDPSALADEAQEAFDVQDQIIARLGPAKCWFYFGPRWEVAGFQQALVSILEGLPLTKQNIKGHR